MEKIPLMFVAIEHRPDTQPLIPDTCNWDSIIYRIIAHFLDCIAARCVVWLFFCVASLPHTCAYGIQELFYVRDDGFFLSAHSHWRQKIHTEEEQ